MGQSSIKKVVLNNFMFFHCKLTFNYPVARHVKVKAVD